MLLKLPNHDSSMQNYHLEKGQKHKEAVGVATGAAVLVVQTDLQSEAYMENGTSFNA